MAVGYEFAPRLSLAGNVKNLLNEDTVRLRYGSLTPGYAQQAGRSNYAAKVSIGITGSF